MRNIWKREPPNQKKMTSKTIICTLCNIEKEHNEFSRNKKQCKACNIIKRKENKKKYQREYYLKNQEEIKENSKEYQKNHTEALKITRQNYRENNRDVVRQIDLKYRTNNKEKVKETKKKSRNKPESKVQYGARRRFKNLMNSGTKDFIDIIGCSNDILRKWFEYNFDSNMNWDNYGSYWHIDHIKPCSSYSLDNEDQYKECFNWKNLRPCEKRENLLKSNKIDLVLINRYKNIALQFKNIMSF